MKLSHVKLLALMALIPGMNAFSQPAFEVVSLDGSAKVQRVQKKDWDKLSAGSQVHDNDMVETYSEARLVMHFGRSNAVILGPNSKALFNIRERKTTGRETVLEVNLTVFNGGCFTKALSGCHASVYTSNAVAETDSGSLCTAVDPKSGETGFQTLGGSVRTRNIAQKEGVTLSSGQATTIFPAKEPSAPSYVTMHNVTMLKHLFGNDYIDAELGAAGIKPTEENAVPSQAEAMQQPGKSAGASTYKRLFSENTIWGSILSDREKNGIRYTLPVKPDVSQERRLEIEESNSLALTSVGLRQVFAITPSFTSDFFSAGIRVSIAANYTGLVSQYDFPTAQGILDMVDHISLGKKGDSTYLRLGPISDYTLGDGIVVDNFNNANPYSLFHPLGIRGQLKLGDFGIAGFIADVSSFSLGGLHLSYEPGLCRFGAGYFFDNNQYYQDGMDSSGYRFVKLHRADSATVNRDSSLSAQICQLDFSADVVSEYDMRVSLGAQFAQKIIGLRGDGFVLRGPVISVIWRALSIEADISAETGRLTAGQFNSFYMSNRARVIDTAAGVHDTLITPNNILGTSRSSGKIGLAFGISPVRGTALTASYRQNIYDRDALSRDTTYSSGDFEIGLSFSVNDSLWQPIKYGALYLRESHGGLYPPRTDFPSWGLCAGLDLITNPIIFGVGLSAGFSMYYLDMNSNNVIEPSDNVMEFHIGLRYGFL